MNTRAIVVSLLLGALLVGPPVGMPSAVSSAASPGGARPQHHQGATPQHHQATRQAAPPRRHPRLVMPARNVIGGLWTVKHLFWR